MEIINRKNAKIINDVCGKIEEMYNSDNLSLSVATITGKSEPHKHEKTEEVYFILKGQGTIYIDGESKEIGEGDLIPIPKNKFHHIEMVDNKTIELFVITHPKFDASDVLM